MDFSKSELEKICKAKNIKLNIHRWREVCNNKTITRIDNVTSYEPVQECLWPSSRLAKLPEISSYIEKLEGINGKKVYYCFRNARYQYTEGIFSNLVNRDIVEEEFLKKGIAITENIQDHKGLYPLGYNLTPSFGFGSFCATDLNISNTCPIVLWWGNVIEKGNELDCWYPLLPRRISDKDVNPFDADWEPEETEDDGYDDVFDTCPDCGCGISLRNDGGNGFCIDCAWNHQEAFQRGKHYPPKWGMNLFAKGDGFAIQDKKKLSPHVETIVLLSKGAKGSVNLCSARTEVERRLVDSRKVKVDFQLEDMDLSEFKGKATYEQIKACVLEQTGLKASQLYIAQIKKKCGLDVGENFNLPKSENVRQPQCTPEKE